MKARSSSKRDQSELKKQNERLRSFLQKEIEDVEKILEPLKGAKADSLRNELNLKRESIESEDDGEFAFFLLASLRKDIVDLKERAASLSTRPTLSERIPPPVWLAIIPLLLVIYIAYLAVVQRIQQPLIRGTQTTVAEEQTMTASVPETPAPASLTATP